MGELRNRLGSAALKAVTLRGGFLAGKMNETTEFSANDFRKKHVNARAKVSSFWRSVVYR